MINTKTALLQSPVVSSILDVKTSALQTLPKALDPVLKALPMLLRSTLCNIGCPLLGTEQCKKDHCDGYEETEDISEKTTDTSEETKVNSEETEDLSGIEPRTKEVAFDPYNIVEADDDTV